MPAVSRCPAKSLTLFVKLDDVAGNPKTNIQYILNAYNPRGKLININTPAPLNLPSHVRPTTPDQQIYVAYKNAILKSIEARTGWYCTNPRLLSFILTQFHRELARTLSMSTAQTQSRYPSIEKKKFVEQFQCVAANSPTIVYTKIPNYENIMYRYSIISKSNIWDLFRAIKPTVMAHRPINKYVECEYWVYKVDPICPHSRNVINKRGSQARYNSRQQ
jgi:hypothetical protein